MPQSKYFRQAKGAFLPGARIVFLDLPLEPVNYYIELPWEEARIRLSPEDAALIVHEDAHGYHAASTSVGVLLSWIEIAKIRLVQEVCKELQHTCDKLYVPLRSWYKVVQDRRVKEILANTISNYSCLDLLKRVLLGESSCSQGKAALALRRTRDIFAAQKFPDAITIYESATLKESDHCCPIGFGTNAGQIDLITYVGALHMFESWAHSLEVLLLKSSLASAEFNDAMTKRHYGPYRIGIGTVTAALPSLQKEGWADVVLNVAAICHLALMSPLFVQYAKQDTLPLSALHPGSRFFWIITALEGKQVAPLRVQQLGNDYAQWVSGLCDYLHWPSPFTYPFKGGQQPSSVDVTNPIMTGMQEWRDLESILPVLLNRPFGTILYPIYIKEQVLRTEDYLVLERLCPVVFVLRNNLLLHDRARPFDAEDYHRRLSSSFFTYLAWFHAKQVVGSKHVLTSSQILEALFPGLERDGYEKAVPWYQERLEELFYGFGPQKLRVLDI